MIELDRFEDMSKKRNDKSGHLGGEIVPLREHRRITLLCPECEQSSLMDIRQKTRIRGKVIYYVTCPNCSYSFKQIGRPYNFWRDINKRYKLDSKQIRSMQRGMIRKLIETGDIETYENDDTIRTGNMIFIKPKKQDDMKVKTLVLCPLKETKVYRWVCLEECTWYRDNKCPLMTEKTNRHLTDRTT